MLNIPSRMEGPEQKTIIGKTEITVSSKGIANGKSVYLNNGADFGPDTPGTNSYGLVEASKDGNSKGGAIIKMSEGTFYTSVQIPLYDYVSFEGVGVNTIIKSTAAAGLTLFKNPQFFATHKNFQIVSASSGTGQLAWGFDVSQPSELGGNITLEKITFDGVFSSGWFKSDNSDQFRIVSIYITGQTTAQPLGFSAVNSQCEFYDSYMEGVAITGKIGSSLNQIFQNCQMDTLQLGGEVYSLSLINHYNYDDGKSLIDLNGYHVDYLYVSGYVGVKNGVTLFKNSSATANQIGQLDFHAYLQNDGNAGNKWIDTNTSILHLHVSAPNPGTALSGMPFVSVALNGIYGWAAGLGFGATTPALPAGTGSANAVQNTNPYSVRIFQTGSSGTHIIDASGNDVALPSEPTVFELDTGCKVYYATTVATSWKWYGC